MDTRTKRVQRARTRFERERSRALRRYQEALSAELEAGASLSVLAKDLGTSKQVVAYTLKRASDLR